MSDDDFVAKPIRTYKRKRRRAPNVPTEVVNIEHAVAPIEISTDSYSVLDKTGVAMTDLDVFLNSKNEVLGRSVFTENCLPDLEIETVPREEEDMSAQEN
ncbi:hypothetical protein ACHWQZ_G006292 [Mnemiopsis leidyi]